MLHVLHMHTCALHLFTACLLGMGNGCPMQQTSSVDVSVTAVVRLTVTVDT